MDDYRRLQAHVLHRSGLKSIKQISINNPESSLSLGVVSTSWAPSSMAPYILAETGEELPPTALSPWIWIPWLFVVVCCLLFISLRRAQSVELYGRAQEYLRTDLLPRLPFHSTFSSRGGARGGIRLSTNDIESLNRLSTGYGDDDDDDNSLEGDDRLLREDDTTDTADELPSGRSSLSTRAKRSVATTPWREVVRAPVRGLNTVLDVLGYTTGDSSSSSFSSTMTKGWNQQVKNKEHRLHDDAGIAKAFWGIRTKDRVGGIKLNTDDSSGVLNASGKLRNDNDSDHYSSSSSQIRQYKTRALSTSTVGSGLGENLFDVGDEDQTGGGNENAVELPRDFRLPSATSDEQGDPLQGGTVAAAAAPALKNAAGNTRGSLRLS